MLLTSLAAPLGYAVIRPWIGSDAAALALAGALPALATAVQAVVHRRAERWAVLSAAAFALAGLASVLAGGSSLPLKLHEAAVIFTLGLVLLAAAIVRRPLPVSRFLRIPEGSWCCTACSTSHSRSLSFHCT